MDHGHNQIESADLEERDLGRWFESHMGSSRHGIERWSGAMMEPLFDTFGRRHNNLRISVTDRCNLRCTYCMPEDVSFLEKSELLSFEEITRFVETVAPLGIDKIRLTGGEPLLRRELPRLVRMLAEIPGIHDIGL